MASCASLTKCSICFAEMQDPRALNCLHSFCYSCISRLHQGSQQTGIRCPTCRELTNKLPHELPKDFRIEQFRALKPLVKEGERQLLAKAKKEAAKVLAVLPTEVQQKKLLSDCESQIQQSQTCKNTTEFLELFVTEWLENVKRSCKSVAEQHSNRQKELERRKTWAEHTLAVRQIAEKILLPVETPDACWIENSLRELRSLQALGQQPMPNVEDFPDIDALSKDEATTLHHLLTDFHNRQPNAGSNLSDGSAKRLLLKLAALNVSPSTTSSGHQQGATSNGLATSLVDRSNVILVKETPTRPQRPPPLVRSSSTSTITRPK